MPVARTGMKSMQAYAQTGFIAGKQPSQQKKLRLRETHSGLSIVEESKARFDGAYIAEVAFKLVGVLLLPAGGIVMFLPRLTLGHSSMITQICMLAAFVFLGVSLHRWANKGFQRRIQVNPTRQEICIGTQNIEGTFNKQYVFSSKSIESFFIVRSKNRQTPAKLKMRLSDGHSLCLFESGEKALVPILERISVAMQPPKKRNQRVRTKANGDFIRVSFG